MQNELKKTQQYILNLKCHSSRVDDDPQADIALQTVDVPPDVEGNKIGKVG